jgi:phosphoadenosine phosphosulfate reductase
MYGYEWTNEYGIFRLIPNAKIIKEIRPVFKEELDYFGMNNYWNYPNTKKPILWAEGIRRYVLNGECIAEARGGGFYSKPELVIHKKKLDLKPIDISRLWDINVALLEGLEQKAIAFVREQHSKFSEQGYAFAVAFSGGKDSLALLDIVSHALSPEEFHVVFSNTGMELSCTIQAVEQSKQHWNTLHFHEAESHFSPEQSWSEFGIPGRRLRWCCSVHKSVPTILKMREITNNYDVQTVVFDGVRADESARRSDYDDVSIGAKNINQVNCRPIFHWSSSELYIYLMKNNILLNDAYRYGMNRVGCTICPLSSGWRDSLCAHIFPDEIRSLLTIVEKYTDDAGIPDKQKTKYIETNGWRTRMGGRHLQNAGNRFVESVQENKITFDFSTRTQDWLKVSNILGPVLEDVDNLYVQIINNKEFNFEILNDGNTITYYQYGNMDRYIISHLRGIANKVAFCIGCKTCMVECPCDAFVIDSDGEINIRKVNCTHCGNCIDFTDKGCLVAKSLRTTGGGIMNLKGMDRYKTFGFRKPWLENYFDYGTDCFSRGELGNRQYDSLKVWLRESGLLAAINTGEKSGTPTELYEHLKSAGAYNPLTWAAIWSNLAYNSIIIKWYMLRVPPKEIYDKKELVFMLGDDYSQSTRGNAITSLLETLRHSPIGSALKQGIPIPSGGNTFKFAKEGYESPDPRAILYALYLFAEKTGRYSFSLANLAETRNSIDAVGVDPVSIFALEPSEFKDVLQAISLHYDKYIRTTFVADLDTVKLMPEISSLDIVDLFQE